MRHPPAFLFFEKLTLDEINDPLSTILDRQQIYRRDEKVPPFINIVSYNSKRLFNNMVTSSRRYLYTDDNKKEETTK